MRRLGFILSLFGLLCLCSSHLFAAPLVSEGASSSANLGLSLPPAESELLWKWKAPNISIQHISVYDTVVYAVAPTAGIWRLSDKGYAVWNNPAQQADIEGSYLNTLWVSTQKQNLLAIDKQYGYTLWQHHFDQKLISNVFTFSESVWVIDAGYKLWRIDARTGQKAVWMTLDGLRAPVWIGASPQRELCVVGGGWQKINIETKVAYPIDLGFFPADVNAQWLPQLSGIYFISTDRHLQHYYQTQKAHSYDVPGVDRYYMPELDHPVLYNKDRGQLTFYKNYDKRFEFALSVQPLGVGQIDSFNLVFLPKGEIIGIDQRKWQTVFNIALDTPPQGSDVIFDGETAYYINYDGAVVAAIVVVDLF